MEGVNSIHDPGALRATPLLALMRTVDAERFGLGRGTRYTERQPN